MAETSGKRMPEQGRQRVTLSYVRVSWPVPKDAFAIIVKGDSMEPELSENDVLVLVPCDEPSDGDIVAIDYRDDVVVKRFKMVNGEAYLVPGNAKYQAIKKTADDEILGKVVEMQRKYC